jgi:glyoxylase I family protein
MRFEHVGYNLSDPVASAKWYVQHLGLKIACGMAEPPYTHFLADSSGRVVFETYRNPTVAVPDYANQNMFTFHIAFQSDDVRRDRDRLVAAGARVEVDVPAERAGDKDEVVTLRDPWGVPFQFAKRAKPME